MPQTTVSDKPRVADWKRVVSRLLDDIESWSAGLEWPTARQPKKLREKGVGVYEVDDLVIKTPSGLIVVDVKGRNVADADGRVDLYILHNVNRMILIRKGKHWILKTDSGVRWPKAWSRETFAELPELLVNAA